VVLTVALSTLLLFAWCGSWLVQRRADHADVSEVLRLAD
jgi:hypothetical protein